MSTELVSQVVQSVLSSKHSFLKFLSANDTGATGGHQSGILVSKTAKEMLFKEKLLEESILKRTVNITWQNDFMTQSSFTYYKSKNELRITRFGRSFPFLNPEQTGALFVLTKQGEEDYSGYFLETEEEIEELLSTFNISPTETNRLIDASQIHPETREKAAILEFISQLEVEFPTSIQMSFAARDIQDRVYQQKGQIMTNPDLTLIQWTNMEYTLFRALEYSRYGKMIANGFTSVDDFVSTANMVLNRRKSRAGKSLEHHLSAIFDGNQIAYAPQATTEGNKKPDFIFPSHEAYHDLSYPTHQIHSLAAKTTCKDRWRQIINEADRLRGRTKFLCTLQQGISPAQMDEMQAEQITLVVPKPYITTYPKDRQDRIWTLAKFIAYIRETKEGSQI